MMDGSMDMERWGMDHQILWTNVFGFIRYIEITFVKYKKNEDKLYILYISDEFLFVRGGM